MQTTDPIDQGYEDADGDDFSDVLFDLAYTAGLEDDAERDRLDAMEAASRADEAEAAATADAEQKEREAWTQYDQEQAEREAQEAAEFDEE